MGECEGGTSEAASSSADGGGALFLRRMEALRIHRNRPCFTDKALERFEHQGGDLENHGLVDILHDMTRHDEQRLRLLIEKHRRYTGSEKARRILENWPDYASRFLKIMPVDYRLALEKMQKVQEQAQLSH